jgi:subtilisin-like proprotein convertase family protein
MTPKSRSKWILILCIAFFINSNLFSQTICREYIVDSGTPISYDGGDNLVYETAIQIDESFTISDVNINIDVQHLVNEDLDIFLVSPSGTEVELSTDNGGTPQFFLYEGIIYIVGFFNYSNVTFDDASNNTLPTDNDIITGDYQPEGELGDFNEENSAGEWTLKIIDDTDGFGGIINYVKLYLCYDSETADESDTDGDSVLDKNDVDDDNDGILDSNEGLSEDYYCPNLNPTNRDISNDGDVVLYNQIGEYPTGSGNQIDLKISLVEKSNIDIIANFNRTDYILALEGPDELTGSVKLLFEFFETGTNNPVELPSQFIWKDIDYGGLVNEAVSFNKSQINSYVTSEITGIVVTENIDGDIKFSSNIDNDIPDEEIWVKTNILPLSSFNVTFTKSKGALRGYLFGCDQFNEATKDPVFTSDLDTDGDNIPNKEDLDSDNDGITDNIEAQTTIDYIAPNEDENTAYESNSGLNSAYTPSGLIPVNSDGVDKTDYTDLDSDNDGIFDILEVVDLNINPLADPDPDNDGKYNGEVGTNGLDNTLFAADNYTDVNAIIDDPTLLPDEDSDVLTVGDVNFRDTELSGIPMITQIHHSATEKIIEITNVHPTHTIQANTVKLSLYTNKTGAQIDITPDATYTITSSIAPGASILITKPGSEFSGIENAPLTSFADANDVLLLTHPKSAVSGMKDWKNRYDTNTTFNNNTSYIRTDEVNSVSKDFNSDEWVAFVDNGVPERHPHAPLLSEIDDANEDENTKYNIAFGKHRFGPTHYTGGEWNNGTPDRSRRVVIDENYIINSESLHARKLTVSSDSKLTVINNVLIVSEDIILTSLADEIRLVGNSQLIQTHTDNGKVTGDGKLYIDRGSPTASTYRYNYMSSPVTSAGNTFTVSDVLKDGTNQTSATSTVKNINFISGYNGNASDPIAIADYWIYTYASANGTRSNWNQKRSDNTISATDGFTLKGPGIAQNYTFIGTPNDGNLITAIGENESYLVGNPYASAISAKKFIEDNISSIDGTLYFWQHADEEDIASSNIAGHSYDGYIGGYGTRNLVTGVAADAVGTNNSSDDTIPSIGNGSYTTPANYIPVGQGFFISGDDADGGQIVFNNSQREYKTEGVESVFFRGNKTNKKVHTSEVNHSNSIPIIKFGLNYTDSEGTIKHRQIGISFNKNNTFEREYGYDSELYDESETDFYWKFPNNDAKYSIAGVEEISKQLIVPFEINIEKSGEILIEVDEWNLVNKKVYIKDKLTQKYYLLSKEKVLLKLDAGKYEDRFVLCFEGAPVSDLNNQILNNSLVLYYDKTSSEIVVYNETSLEIKKIELYNLLGQKINYFNDFNPDQLESRFKIRNPSHAVYVVKVYTSKGGFTKKIIMQ